MRPLRPLRPEVWLFGPLNNLMSVTTQYHQELAQRGYTSDPAQLKAVQVLDKCAHDWADYKDQSSNVIKKLINRPDIPKGVYMFGGVGRG